MCYKNGIERSSPPLLFPLLEPHLTHVPLDFVHDPLSKGKTVYKMENPTRQKLGMHWQNFHAVLKRPQGENTARLIMFQSRNSGLTNTGLGPGCWGLDGSMSDAQTHLTWHCTTGKATLGSLQQIKCGRMSRTHPSSEELSLRLVPATQPVLHRPCLLHLGQLGFLLQPLVNGPAHQHRHQASGHAQQCLCFGCS